MKRKIILLLMVMILLLGMFTPAYATKSARSNDYISLGDSIAVGTRLVQNPDFPTIPIPFIPATPILDGPGEMYYEGSYYYLYEEHFKKSISLAVDGKDSETLLQDLQTDTTTIKAVRKAKETITISIGSNDLLGRIMDAAYAYGLSNPYLEDPPLNPTYEEKLAYFAYLAGEVDISIVLPQLIIAADLPSGAFEFSNNLPAIIATIKELNPDVEIKLLNIYNPLYGEPLGAELEAIISGMPGVPGMNSVIDSMAFDPNVIVIDVHGAFAATISNPIPFKAELFDPFSIPPYLDPHPTSYGHELIYNLLTTP